MADTGILGERDRVELIDGELIDMAPIGQDHAATVGWLNRALVLAFADRAIIWPQNPIRIDQLNEPQPDFAVLRPRADFYRAGEPPGPADVLLLIEVADSSLRYDRVVKLPMYARAGIAEIWLIDLQRRVLETHRHPGAAGYAEMTSHAAGSSVTPSLAPDVSIPLGPIFG